MKTSSVSTMPGDPLHATFHTAAVVTDSPIASRVGRRILENGGGCVDAAIAICLVNGMTNAHSMGLGGGFLCVFAPKDRRRTALAYDARVTPPRRHLPGDHPVVGPNAIGIPSEMLGYWTLHRSHGKLPWAKLFEPAIQLAKEGFVVSPSMKKGIGTVVRSNMEELKENPPVHESFKEFYSQIFDNILSGVDSEVFLKYELLAKTLEKFASIETSFTDIQGFQDDGSREMFDSETQKQNFYTCFDDIVADLEEIDSFVTRKDIEYYVVDVRPALRDSFGENMEFLTCLPSAGGCISMALLKICDKALKLIDPSFHSTHKDTLIEHVFLEASKFAYQFFTLLADTMMYEDEMKEFLEDILLKDENLHALASRIQPTETYSASFYAQEVIKLTGEFWKKIGLLWQSEDIKNNNEQKSVVENGHSGALPPMSSGTSHMNIVDQFGDAISLTSSVNFHYGSNVIGRRSGVLFNNGMRDFNQNSREIHRTKVNLFRANPLHSCAPMKRPVSGQSPMIMRSTGQDSGKEILLVLGGAGESRIISALGMTICQWYYRHLPLDVAVAYPRIRHEFGEKGDSGFIKIANASPEFVEKLAKSHNQAIYEDPIPLAITVVGALESVTDGGRRTLLGVCDAKKPSLPDGF